VASIPDDNLDDSAAIQTSLQEAASKGDTLTIPPGTYNIDDPDGVSVILGNQDFSIIATDVIFIAGPNVNSDLIDFDATSESFSGRCGGDDLVDVSWTGGELNISQAHLSGTVPQGRGIGATSVGDPVASTTDGLSVRGATGGTDPRAKVNAVTIKGLTIIGAPIGSENREAYFENFETGQAVDSESDSWRNAGGDSGVFVVGAQSAHVTVSDNKIRNLGARVAQQNNPVRYDRYEGIVIEGVENGTIINNEIGGVDASRSENSDTVGIVVTSHTGIVGRVNSSNIRNLDTNQLSNLDSDVEQ